ncbi:MAG: O-antigen ligase family protein [Deltaproteobacteria bacterium]|nr:O-antigen ligase family protein [Deltaproteobacteria bacterium]
MKYTLFILLLLAIIIGGLYPINLGIMRGITPKTLLMYAILIYILFSEAAKKNLHRKKIPCISSLLIFLTILCVSIALNVLLGRMDMSLFDQIRQLRYRFIEPVVLYILMFLLIDTASQARKFLQAGIVLFVLVNVAAFIAMRAGVLNLPTVSGDLYSGRYTGTFANPNQMAYFFCFLMPITYHMITTAEIKTAGALQMLALASEIAFILMSGSRGGILAMVIVLGWITIHHKDFKTVAFLFIFGTVFIAIGFLVHNDILRSSFDRIAQQTFSNNVKTISAGRSSIWLGLEKIYLSNIYYVFMGTGFETARFQLAKHTGILLPPHNLYLQILVELGLIGFAAWLFMLRSFWKFLNISGQRTEFSKATVTALSVLLLAWSFSDLGRILRFIAIMVGIMFSMIVHDKDTVKKTMGKSA